MTTTNQKINLNNCTDEQLFKAMSKNPTPLIFSYDNHSSEQYVAFIIALIILLNQHGDASKQQAEAKGVNTHQAALFASSTQGLSVLRKYEQQDWQALLASPTELQALLATVRTTQRDVQSRREQKYQHIEYEQQDWQAVLESDTLPLPSQARC
jgi:hypothetical protein